MSANGGIPYHGGHYTSRQHLLLGVTGCGLVLSTLAVSLRLIARRYLHVKLWWDDYLAVLAMTIQYIPLISTIIGVRAGLGRHSSELSSDQAKTIGITAFIHQCSYVTAFALVNVQVLMLYIRLFPLTGLHKVCWIVGAFSTTWGVTNLIVLLSQCIPIPHFWAPDTKGHCIHQANFYAAATVIATLNILVIFCIPIPILRKLKISTSKKWSLTIAFTLGTLACIAAIVRFVLYFTVSNDDQSWTIARTIFWGCLEISSQVVSANIPSLMPLFLALANKEHRMSNKYRDHRYRADQYRDNKHPSDENGLEPKPSKPRKPRDLLSLGSADPLPEGLEISLAGAIANDDYYDMRLIDTVKKSSEGIVVTDKIEQVSVPASEMAVSRQPSAEGLPSAK